MKTNPVQDWMAWRIKRNKNVIVIINGPTGSGKTYSALEIGRQSAERHDTNFNISDNVSFNFVDLLKKTRKKINNKPGTPYVFEEVGAVGGGASSREWQSKANRLFFTFMQTGRCRNQILIFTCPNFSFLEAGARALCHMQMVMTGINFKQEVALAKPYILQQNLRTGKIYFKNLRFGEKKARLKTFAIKHPPKDMAKEYEVVKDKYVSGVEKSIIDKDEKIDKRMVQSKLDVKKLYRLLDSKLFSIRECATMLNVNERTIYRYKQEREITPSVL